jgi:predicted transcriptional regulator
MPDEITFFDLVALLKIKPGTTVERYGGLINSSFFDGANVLGTLSQKKLVSISTAMPDQNPITVTDIGKQLIGEAETKGKEDFDHLDLAILTQMSNGKAEPSEIGKAVNVRSRDLAMHLYRLSAQDYATYEFVNGSVNLMLTEKGFAQVKAGMPIKPVPPPEQIMSETDSTMDQTPKTTTMMQPPEMLQQKTIKSQQVPMQSAPTMTTPTPDAEQPQAPTDAGSKPKTSKKLIILIVVVTILLIVSYLYYAHYISL